MDESKKTFYITTAIHYANAGPHIGHAYEGVLADIIARYHRGKDEDVFFLSGTDEHGQKIARGAEKAGVEPQVFVDENAKKFEDIYEKLDVSNDEFIRTSDETKHWPGAQKLWEIFEKNSDIYKDVYRGKYCVGCECFLSDRELVDGKCPNHDIEPEEVEEENYFFRLSKYQNEVKSLIESDKIRIQPDTEKNAVLKLLEEPLEDVSFSRPAKTNSWGIPVPGDPDQVMYVWCDALSNYISALGYGRENNANLEKFWPANVHVVGKDIVRFHAVFWPAMLLSAGCDVYETLLVHGHITSEGKKMSKTLGNVIDPNDFVDAYGSDAFRYYLGAEISPVHDGDFTSEKFVESYNGNLANGIGNLVSRTFAMAEKYFDGYVEFSENAAVPLLLENGEEQTVSEFFEKSITPEYQNAMDSLDVNQGAEAFFRLARELDGYITDYEPFKLIKTDEEKTRAVLWNTLYGIWKIAELAAPFMPETSKKILENVNVDGDEENQKSITFSPQKLDEPLFRKIEIQ